MKEFFFVRHGQTQWNAIRRMQGQWNSDLNDMGRTQADINGRFLATLDIEHLVASPLDRTRQTAEIISRHLNTNIEFDDRIKEWDCGDWSGEMWDEVSQKWPKEFSAWQSDRFHYRGPNCENYPDMIARATPFLEELAQLEHQRIAIVSHGIIGKIMVSILLDHNEEEMFSFSQSNDTVFHLVQAAEGFHTQHFVAGDGPFPGLPVGLH